MRFGAGQSLGTQGAHVEAVMSLDFETEGLHVSTQWGTEDYEKHSCSLSQQREGLHLLSRGSSINAVLSTTACRMLS